MAGFFKKALGVFVEFDEETTKNENSTPVSDNIKTTQVAPDNFQNFSNTTKQLNADDIDKFEAHFDKLFDQTNLPGPDYFEFWKMMETLEQHIHDEKARISATFASLSIQGLTKDKLIATANQYKEVILNDKANFEKALQAAGSNEIETRKRRLAEAEQIIQKNSELIQKLTKEISENQVNLAKWKSEIQGEEEKFNAKKNGYNIACEAMLKKITTDIQKIQTTI